LKTTEFINTMKLNPEKNEVSIIHIMNR